MRYLLHQSTFLAYTGGLLALTLTSLAPPVAAGSPFSCSTLPQTLRDDTEVIEAKLGTTPIGLITYVRAGDGLVCEKTGEPMQELYARPLNPITGFLAPEDTETLVASDECGDPFYSEGEWGLTATGSPVLAYTSDDGVRLVSFSGDDWSNVTFQNQRLAGSDDWAITGEPLSTGLEKLQIETVSIEPGGYRVVWSGLSTPLFEVEPIWTFEPLEARFISHVHPGDPTRFIRVDKHKAGPYQGVFEFTEQGVDLAMILDQSPSGNLRVWMMPAEECLELGLANPLDPQACPAMVTSVQDVVEQFWVVAKAQHYNGFWSEVLRIPYEGSPRYGPRLNATVVEHTNPPRSVILVTGKDTTGKDSANVFLLNGNSYLVIEDQKALDSEMLYFSETGMLAVYFANRQRQRTVCTLQIEQN